MKYLSLFAMLVLLISCDITGSSKKDDPSTVRPEADSTLKSITVNNQIITIEDGVIDYRYLLSSSTGSTSDVVISAVAANHNATVSGVGNKVVNNPPIADLTLVDLNNYIIPQEQQSVDTVFSILVLSEDKSKTTKYNLTVSSAPVWAKAIITVPGDGSELNGLQAIYRFRGHSRSALHKIKYYIDLKPIKTQEIAIPLPMEETYSHYSHTEILVDFDNTGWISKGDYYVDYDKKEKIILSKNTIFKYPDFNFKKANKIELINIPPSMTFKWDPDGYLIYRDPLNGKNIIIGDWVDDGNVWFNYPIYGIYELLLYENDDITGEGQIVSLGTHTLNESTDLVFDLSLPQYSVKNEKDLGPTIILADYSTGQITFSQSMDTQSVKPALTIYTARNYYNNNLNEKIRIADITWSLDNTVATIIPEVVLENATDYVAVFETSAKSSSGQHLYNEIVKDFRIYVNP